VLSRAHALTGRSKVFLRRRIRRDLTLLPAQGTSFPSLGLFIPFEASSLPSGAAAVARNSHPISGSVGADTPSLARRGRHVARCDVCPVGGHCEVASDFASLRGVFDVKEQQTLVCRSLIGTQPLGRF
jgi:hypothetical protein